jgi:hypothetical protein
VNGQGEVFAHTEGEASPGALGRPKLPSNRRAWRLLGGNCGNAAAADWSAASVEVRMRWEKLCQLGRELPEVAEGLWYGTAALHVRGRYFVRLKEDGQSVVFRLESLDEQAFLADSQPDVYYVTEHYRGYRAVLAKLRALTVSECRARLSTAWHAVAPKTLVRTHSQALAKQRKA